MHPRSILSLILVGFGVVILPLFVALGYAGMYVDRLSEQAQTTVYDAARAIQLSGNIDDNLMGLERAARQHLILDDPALLEVYRSAHAQFGDNLEQLRRFAATPAQQELLATLRDQEQALYQRLGEGADEDATDETLTQQAVAQRFIRMGEIAEAIGKQSHDVIDEEVARMQSLGSTAQRWLFWMGAGLLPLTLLSAGIFAVLITRPIREVDQAIRRLGSGHFDQPVAVNGPRDLRALGERLEWLRNRLIELENEKTRFLRHVSHEIKTPLTSIRESSQLLSEEVVGPLNAEQQEIAGILDESGRRLQTLLEDLLEFSRTQSQRPRLALAAVALGRLVDEVLARHRAALRAREIDIDKPISDGYVHGDSEKLRTIIDNLISNAVKFSPTGGRIRVMLEESTQEVMLEVQDQGPGIPEQERQRIFEAFYQGVNQPEGHVKGTGLGLSITREYTLAHGGRIEVDGAEHGGIIRIHFPRNNPEYFPAERPSTPTLPPPEGQDN